MRFAARLDQVPPYLFAELERKISDLRSQGVDVISLGIGDPDLPTPDAVIDELKAQAGKPERHQYPSNRGLDSFRIGVAEFYAARFGVSIDPDAEVIPVLGGKEGVAHIALACLNPGDICLSPEPGYPPFTSGPIFAGADIYYMPLLSENRFLPDVGAVPADVWSRANLLFLNYPNNPTGAVATDDFFQGVVEAARQHDVIVVHDASYTEIAFDGYRPPSFLATSGAMDVGVEIFSLSKGWNMTGWRIAAIAGNAAIVEHYRQLKTNLDSGMFDALQVAGTAALGTARDFPQEMSAIYQRRRDLMLEAVTAIGLQAEAPKATPYIWAGVPDGYTSTFFTELVLEQAHVVLSPGPSFGPSGEGFVRLSLTVPDERLDEAASRIASSLRVDAGA